MNLSAIDHLHYILTEMHKSGVPEDATRLSLSKSPAGGYVYMITDHTGSGGVLVGIQRASFQKNLVEIAGLNEDLYSKYEVALDCLSEAEHVYPLLVHGPEKTSHRHLRTTTKD